MSNTKRNLCTAQEAIKEAKKGRMLIVVDSPKRENEADFYVPAGAAAPARINTMLKYGGGLVCAALTEEQARRLGLPLMVPLLENAEKTRVNFTVSVNAKKGVTTGVSAHDRARTIRILADPRSSPADIVKPGHVFGLVARSGGLLEREGHTEAAVDLARLAGLSPSGVLCEIVGANGRMAKRREIMRLSKKLKIKVVAIRDIARYLKTHPLPSLPVSRNVALVSSSNLPTRHGKFAIRVYKDGMNNLEHVALLYGEVLGAPGPALVRVHSRCLTGDTFGSLRCDCQEQLHKSMRLIKEAGSGVVIYLDQEGRGIGLGNKIKAYALQDEGYDTVEANYELGFPADARVYEAAAAILKELKIKEIKLLTNNPEKENQLSALDIKVIECVPLEVGRNAINEGYLSTKKQKLGHRLARI